MTLIMTRANHFFIFSHSAQHDLHWHGQGTKAVLLRHTYTWMLVMLTLHLESIVPAVSVHACAPMTFCGLPPGLVESHFLDESQMQWSSADVDTEPCHARSPTEVNEKCPDYSTSGQISMIWCPTPRVVSCLRNVMVSKSLEELARKEARAHRQPAGKEEDSGTSDESGPLLVPTSARGGFWTTTPPFADADRGFDVS